MRTYLKRLLNRRQAYDELKLKTSYVATERVTGVADTTQALDLYVGNPSGSGVDMLVGVSFACGGATHLDVGESASVGVAGTDLNRQAKGANGTGQATIESGGTYSSSNPIEAFVPGSRRANQPSGAVGSGSLADVRLLEPGEAVQYTLTNQSGNTVDYDAVVDVLEVDRE